ncbi:MAG TPA: FtsQ-type POTRA domain-containing protein [Pyrinomonadaceae bacterium]|nr:FtsQ-type POTRA domain-containing protein [Pyrinomonadaceae bacterium]
MREQVIAHKVGNRSGIGNQRRTSATTQRPARRESGGEALIARLRTMLGYVPALLKVGLAIAVGILMFAGYRAAASASFFQVRNVEVQGTSRVAVEDVQGIVRREVEKTGVWRADLKALNVRLEKLPWIRTAVVSRVLPDGIRVRITERVPRAVVRTASGKFRWVDDDAVLLGEMLPTDPMPPFFLRGLNEDDPAGAQTENRERVAKFVELQKAWDSAGLSERVSEVNLLDLKDIRAQLAGDDSHIEVRLGSQDHSKRLHDALDVLDGQKQSAHDLNISYIDLSQGKRAIVGLASGVHANAATDLDSPATPAPANKPTERDSLVAATRATANSETMRSTESRTKKNRKEETAAQRKLDKNRKPD